MRVIIICVTQMDFESAQQTRHAQAQPLRGLGHATGLGEAFLCTRSHTLTRAKAMRAEDVHGIERLIEEAERSAPP